MRNAIVGFGVFALLAACSGRNSDRQVQICLENNEGNAKFRSILLAVSKRHNLQFFDESKRVENELSALKSNLVGRFPLHQYHIHDKPNGVEVSATNLGLGPYETTLSYDLRNDRQRAVAADLNRSLLNEFKIVSTPKNQGARPLANCPSGAPARKSEGS